MSCDGGDPVLGIFMVIGIGLITGIGLLLYYIDQNYLEGIFYIVAAFALWTFFWYMDIESSVLRTHYVGPCNNWKKPDIESLHEQIKSKLLKCSWELDTLTEWFNLYCPDTASWSELNLMEKRLMDFKSDFDKVGLDKFYFMDRPLSVKISGRFEIICEKFGRYIDLSQIHGSVNRKICEVKYLKKDILCQIDGLRIYYRDIAWDRCFSLGDRSEEVVLLNVLSEYYSKDLDTLKSLIATYADEELVSNVKQVPYTNCIGGVTA